MQQEIHNSTSELNTHNPGDFYENMVNGEIDNQHIGIFETNDGSEMEVDSDQGIRHYL